MCERAQRVLLGEKTGAILLLLDIVIWLNRVIELIFYFDHETENPEGDEVDHYR